MNKNKRITVFKPGTNELTEEALVVMILGFKYCQVDITRKGIMIETAEFLSAVYLDYPAEKIRVKMSNVKALAGYNVKHDSISPKLKKVYEKYKDYSLNKLKKIIEAF